MFRYERPQLGRQREFYQYGVEVIGGKELLNDVNIFTLIEFILFHFKLNDYQLIINYFGSINSKNKYKEYLIHFFEKNFQRLCLLCKNRIQKNIFRIFECSNCISLAGEAAKIEEFYSSEEKKY
jgi:histidyl-tRNA synthetase